MNIEIPGETQEELKKMAIDEGKDLKNYIQDYLVFLVRWEREKKERIRGQKVSTEAEKQALNMGAVTRRACKFYFRTEDDQWCYSLKEHLADAKDEGLTEIELFEAVPENVDGMFLCRAVDEYAEEGYCGKLCEKYAPKNGKSGMCKHKCNKFYAHGEKAVFKVK